MILKKSRSSRIRRVTRLFSCGKNRPIQMELYLHTTLIFKKKALVFHFFWFVNGVNVMCYSLRKYQEFA